MQEIVIRNNGVDSSVFTNAHSISIEDMRFNDDNVSGACVLKFDFDKLEHNHKCKKEPNIWTGKFICVATKSGNRLRYTPGCVYEATELYIADDTEIHFNRGADWLFAGSDFETLRKEFAEQGIDIIEYKDEKTVEE